MVSVFSILLFTRLASYDLLIRAQERGISDVSPHCTPSSTITPTTVSHGLGKFSHRPVNG